MQNNISMDFIILAGGFGTRLSSISNGIPKALMPVGNQIYLDFILAKIFDYDNAHVYLSLYYKSELFYKYVSNSDYIDKITIIVEPEPLGTGGAINYIVNRISSSAPFFVINGDSLSSISLNQMLIEFDKHNLKAMLGISKMLDAGRYGTVIVEKDRVISFQEKCANGSGWINNGHYIMKKNAFDGLKGSFSLEKEVFPILIKNEELGYFMVRNDNFIDMGVPEDYVKLCNIYKENC